MDNPDSCPNCLCCSAFICLSLCSNGYITDTNICWLAWHLFVGGQEFQTFTPIGETARKAMLTMWVS